MVDGVNATKSDLYDKYCAQTQEGSDKESSSIFETGNNTAKCSAKTINNLLAANKKAEEDLSPEEKFQKAKSKARDILVHNGGCKLAMSEEFNKLNASSSASNFFSTDKFAVSTSDIENMTVDQLVLYIISLAGELKLEADEKESKEKADKNKSGDKKENDLMEFFNAVSGISSGNNGNTDNNNILQTGKMFDTKITA